MVNLQDSYRINTLTDICFLMMIINDVYVFLLVSAAVAQYAPKHYRSWAPEYKHLINVDCGGCFKN